MPATIKIENEGRIRHIRLNRVKQMNSLSFELMDELSAGSARPTPTTASK